MEDGIYKQDKLNAYKTNANLQRYSFRSNVDIDITRTVNMNFGYWRYCGRTSLSQIVEFEYLMQPKGLLLFHFL